MASTPTLVTPEVDQIPKAPTPTDAAPANPLSDAEKQPQSNTDPHASPLAQLGQVRKNFLLLIFSIATFVDICNVSGVAVAVSQIARDIDLEISQIVWVSLSIFTNHRSSLHTLYALPHSYYSQEESQIYTTQNESSSSGSSF
jgi:hypothetical protein